MTLPSNLRPLGNRLYLTEFVAPHTYVIDQLYRSLEEPTKKEMVYSCLDWVCRNIKYDHERGDVRLYPSETITKGKTDCAEQASALVRIAP